jgi:hypothetical protein
MTDFACAADEPGLPSEWPMKILFVDIVKKVYEFL